jgi:hypothetical protein
VSIEGITMIRYEGGDDDREGIEHAPSYREESTSYV